MADEHVEFDPVTGGRKGTKLARFDLIPAEALEALAEVYGSGAKKYDDRNWEKGYRYGLSFAAMMRHAWAWWRGEDNDPESGHSHMAHVMWHAATLFTFRRRGSGTDDRSLRKVEMKGLAEMIRSCFSPKNSLHAHGTHIDVALDPRVIKHPYTTKPVPDVAGEDLINRGGFVWDPDPRRRP